MRSHNPLEVISYVVGKNFSSTLIWDLILSFQSVSEGFLAILQAQGTS
jgi:hypothetical protein